MAILLPPIEYFKYSYQEDEFRTQHAARVYEQIPSINHVAELGSIEYALTYQAPTSQSVAEAEAKYNALPESVRTTPIARAVYAQIDDARFFLRAEELMRAAIGGACKMSKHGTCVIFSQPHAGRQDLSGRREQAEYQLRSAGLL